MLTIQMFRIFDKLWKKENLDLQLNPYRVIATGGETGMVEVVTRSNTISKIQKQIGGVC
jgi:phosphatidylinositol kinase/protein kinase (PI-3  family)